MIKSKNIKYFSGKFNGDQFKKYRYWFLGDFFEKGHPLKTGKIEVGFLKFKKGEFRPAHLHKKKMELTILLKGKIRNVVNGKEITISGGEFLYVESGNVVSHEFLKDSELISIHAPGIRGDKILVG